MRGVGRLHAGLAVALVVEHDDGEVGWPLDADRREPAEAHEQLAVAGHHEHPALRPGERQAEPDQRGAAHGAPEREGQRMVAGRGRVPIGAAEARDHQELIPLRQQHFGDLAPAQGKLLAT